MLRGSRTFISSKLKLETKLLSLEIGTDPSLLFPNLIEITLKVFWFQQIFECYSNKLFKKNNNNLSTKQ